MTGLIQKLWIQLVGDSTIQFEAFSGVSGYLLNLDVTTAKSLTISPGAFDNVSMSYKVSFTCNTGEQLETLAIALQSARLPMDLQVGARLKRGNEKSDIYFDFDQSSGQFVEQ